MSPPGVWGPPIWTLFHTLAEKIKEDRFSTTAPILFSFIRRICAYLPCPECSTHATHYLNQIKPENYKTKADFKNIFFIFHNQVNVKKKKPIASYSHLAKYSKLNLIQVYNQFIRVYNTKGNMKMLTESFQRQFVIKDFKNWMIQNIHCFDCL